ncbi:Sec61gamma [Drosophila busckii]|uniref:Sec61gamma n=1 Tax=Drosophila busckii TaxID=30019 RepID=A0A0M4EFR9_DROBS|nr:protein transport protein Sec61 subunit gamma [Drosophila busckii]ALC42251.1 Sec61gamma [Drosophila busckii]
MEQRLHRRRRTRKKPKSLFNKLLGDWRPKLGATTSCSYKQLLLNQLLPLRRFFKSSKRVVKRCTKPDRREFRRAALATAVGFLIMGFLGYGIRLLHIPITNIIMD